MASSNGAEPEPDGRRRRHSDEGRIGDTDVNDDALEQLDEWADLSLRESYGSASS